MKKKDIVSLLNFSESRVYQRDGKTS